MTSTVDNTDAMTQILHAWYCLDHGACGCRPCLCHGEMLSWETLDWEVAEQCVIAQQVATMHSIR